MKQFVPLTTLCSVILIGSTIVANAATPAVGDKAPLVEGNDQNEKTWKLADHIGQKNVLLYFYPKDDTPGCTREACGLRDQMSDLKAADVEVVGVSFDSAESHRAFVEKHSLNFTLLADTDGKIAEAYGAKREGRNVARRVSFLINKQGIITHVTDTGSADTHLTEMKEAVAKLKSK